MKITNAHKKAKKKEQANKQKKTPNKNVTVTIMLKEKQHGFLSHILQVRRGRKQRNQPTWNALL